ncbi:MAG: TRAP transporter small permease [Rectinemataceae bacterium]|nr:TRAP transporter small permease [Rectinemataceae bacterium]
MQNLGILDKAIKGLEKAVEWVVTIIIAVMVINITAGVFFRYVLGNSLVWTEELSRYLMVWAGMLGAGLAMADGSHVGIDLLVDRCPPALRHALKITAKVVIQIFLIIVVIKSFAYLDTLKIQKSSAMEMPMVIPYLSVCAGTIFMSLENLLVIIRLFLRIEKPGTAE